MGQQRLHLLLLTAAAFTLWPFDLILGAEQSVRAKEGSEAVLGCSVAAGTDVGTASPRHVVEWVREGFDIPILIKFGTYAPRVHPEYEGRVSLLGDGALSVGALRLEDQGRYECRILPLEQHTDEETRNGSWALLSVYAAPTFTETPPPVTEALLGRPLTLRCVVRGSPPPRVTWAKNGVLLKQNKTEVRTGTVSFQSITREMAGEYRCHASNSEGNVSHVTQLSVKGPPVIRIPPKDMVLNISQKAELQCQAEADPPNMTYVWQKEGENVYHIQSLKSRVKVLIDGTLLISRLAPEDSGNYSCTPTNGLPTPPSASASLTVRHPAQALYMPKETYLPTGMGGVISCPVRAEPPLLRVDWTKDGKRLDLDKYPGWTLTSQGSVVMATANEDAAGVYTCTPYNSYGTMGESEPTRVILQDPPSLKVSPRKEYRQEVGRMLVMPCEAAGHAAPRVTWSKVGRTPSSPFSVAPNGSLVLQPLSKDHQGVWLCSASNRVATVNVSTTVLVLGTSPHAVPLLSVFAGLTHANVSWEPGFDGGYTQKFTIWLKRMSSEAGREKQEWASVPVPPSAGTSFRVTGLQPSTEYQFSILSQNKMGTGPFSDITSARTLDPQPVVKELVPPTLLSANATAGGVVIRWKAVRGQVPPIQSFLLQSRQEGGQWSNLVEGINANRTHMVLQDLSKDSVYELRLLSQRGDEQSRPSAPMTISTEGLEVSVSPASRGRHQVVPEPLLAGMISGLGLLCVALLLTIGTACVYRRRSARRKRRMDDLAPALLTSPSGTASAAGGSPDSVLKHKLLPPPSHSSTSTSSSSYPSDPSSFERSSHRGSQSQQRKGSRPHSLPFPESTLSRGNDKGRGSGPLSPLSPLELISRGPDGRFSLDTLDESASLSFSRGRVVRNLQDDFLQLPSTGRGGAQRSHSLRSYQERNRDRDAPFVVSVNLPPSNSAGYNRGRIMAKHLSLQGDYLLGRDGDHNLNLNLRPSTLQLPENSSLLSEGSDTSDGHSESPSELEQHPGTSSGYATMKHSRGTRPTTGASLLMLQMEHERETGNLSRCLTLAREREALERELRMYSSDRHSLAIRDHHHEEYPDRQEPELIWKSREGASPNRGLHTARGCYSPGNSGRASTRPSSRILWEASPVSSPTHLVPVQTPPPPDSERAKRSPLCEAAEPDPTLLEQCSRSLRRASELRRTCASPDRLSVAELRSRDYQGAIEVENTGVAEAQESVDTIHANPDECTYIEMSVDGPEIEERCHTMSADRRRHHRNNNAQQDAHTHWERGGQGNGQPSRIRSHQDMLRPDLRKTGSLGRSQRWNGYQSTQSLDYRRRGEFLTPDAWVHSLTLGRANSAIPFSSLPQREDEDEDQGEIQSIEPYSRTPFMSGTPTSQSREMPSTPYRVPQSPPSRGTPNSPYRDPLNSPGQMPDPCRQASSFPQESRGNPNSSAPSRGNSPQERKGGCTTPGRVTSPPPTQPGHSTPGRGRDPHNRLPTHWPPLPGRALEQEQGRGPAVEEEEEAREEESHEVDAEIRRYRNGAADTEGRYHSYASQSSGRGSLDPPTSPPLTTSSPETTEESEHEEKGLRRRGSSVDENYEWDTHYIPMKSLHVKPARVQHNPQAESRGPSRKATVEKTSKGAGDGGMFPSVRLLKSGGSFSCAGLPHQSGVGFEPETVLF